MTAIQNHRQSTLIAVRTRWREERVDDVRGTDFPIADNEKTFVRAVSREGEVHLSAVPIRLAGEPLHRRRSLLDSIKDLPAAWLNQEAVKSDRRLPAVHWRLCIDVEVMPVASIRLNVRELRSLS